MRGSLNILKSKYIRIFIVTVMVLLLILAMVPLKLPALQSNENIFSEDKMAELTGDKFETIFSVGKYEDIHVADSEKGIFVVQDGSTEDEIFSLAIIDRSGETMHASYKGRVKKQAGRSFLVEIPEGWQFLSLESLEKTGNFMQKAYDYAEIHSSGRYALLGEDGRYFVLDTEGREIYLPQKYKEGGKMPFLVEKEGYIVERDEEDKHFIVNMETGKTEYKAPEGVAVAGYEGGMWLMNFVDEGKDNGFSCSYYYLLDDNYQVTADGAIITSTKLAGEHSDKYLSVQQEKNADYDSREKMHSKGWSGKTTYKRVYRNDGRLVFDAVDERYYEGTNGSRIRHIKGDILAVSGLNEQFIDYINLETGEMIAENSKIFSFMDHEDGAAAACICRKSSDYDDRGGNSLLINRNNYLWGLVDENLQPLTEFVFDGVNPGDNGYAVVIKDGQKGLIRLKGVE
ncbi:MAG: WG repeat-containing protein [Firmicutes bacterium]|nr:WG repeat-containing protein [Bacillota bacterium]